MARPTSPTFQDPHETRRTRRGPKRRFFFAAAAGLLAFTSAGSALAQSVCLQLEAQLSAVERGGGGNAREVARLERLGRQQEMELDRAINDARRRGCGGYGRGPLICDEIDYQIERMEANLSRLDSQIRQASRGGSQRQRDAILRELNRQGCTDDPRQARQAPPPGQPNGGLFAFLFGGPRIIDEAPQREQDRREERPDPQDSGGVPRGGTFRTLCVRETDGYYWPISYSTSDNRFDEDEQTCKASCPNQNVSLYVHRNPGEWSENMVSLDGRRYSDLPNAFLHRTKYVADAKCERPNAIEVATDESDVQPMPAVATPADDIRNMVMLTRLPVPKPDPNAPAEEVDTHITLDDQTAPVAGIEHLDAEDGKTVTTEKGREIRIVGPTFYPVQ